MQVFTTISQPHHHPSSRHSPTVSAPALPSAAAAAAAFALPRSPCVFAFSTCGVGVENLREWNEQITRPESNSMELKKALEIQACGLAMGL